MSAPRASRGWFGGLAAFTAISACGRIGYVPDEATVIDGPYAPGLGDGSAGSSSGAGPEASSDAAATVSKGPGADVDSTTASSDSDSPDSTASTADATELDALADQAGESAASDALSSDAGDAGIADAGPDGPDLDCGAACCCAYVCKYPLVPVASTCGGASDPAQFSFETDIQGWQLANAANTTIPGQTSRASNEIFSGATSLLVTTSVPAGSAQYVRRQTPSPFVTPGSTVTFHVWLPAGAPIMAIQPYVMDVNYTFTGSYVEAAQLVLGCWSTIVVNVPATFVEPQFEIGVQFVATSSAPYNGIAYVDAVGW